jgi:hypothetical protein
VIHSRSSLSLLLRYQVLVMEQFVSPGLTAKARQRMFIQPSLVVMWPNMRRALSNNRAGLHKGLGLLLLCLLLSGCVVATPKRWDCTVPVDGEWSCSSLLTDRTFNCQYTHER